MQAAQCRPDTFEGNDYLRCSADPANLRLFWTNATGEPLRLFDGAADMVEEDGQTLVFAMNAGMYGENFRPLGLYVEHGEERVPLNTRSIQAAPGQTPNFYKEPNGVFFVDESGSPGILETAAYRSVSPSVQLATQSGPMLVIDGKLHPALIEGSTDRNRRSGVAVCAGEVFFVISDSRVNFHDFAKLFQDHLGCGNALYLDGGRGTGVYDPDLGRNDYSWHGGFGPMIGIVK